MTRRSQSVRFDTLAVGQYFHWPNRKTIHIKTGRRSYRELGERYVAHVSVTTLVVPCAAPADK